MGSSFAELSEFRSMENKERDDQNWDRNTEKPEQPVFHSIYSLFVDIYVGWKLPQDSLGNYSEHLTRAQGKHVEV
jgi:hypothetical protein